MEKIYISRDGLDNLKEEMAYLNDKRMQVAATIEFARSLGDLKENAEYHSAKEEQAMLHAKLKDIEDKIARAVILEDQDIDTTKAFVGAKVRVLNQKTKKEIVFTLVSPVEADMASGKISVKSPVGAALLGTVVGDVAVAKVPAGDVPFKILEISR
jgi:transcription elongation factor GreA